jgi:hypothetical protein
MRTSKRLSEYSHRRQTVEDAASCERLPSVYHALASVATVLRQSLEVRRGRTVVSEIDRLEPIYCGGQALA